MSYFPFFLDLSGKSCIIVGDGKVARRKEKTLRSYGGDVFVYGAGAWSFEQLKDAFLVIAATNDRSCNQTIGRFCKEHKIWVNVADSKEESDFLFPSTIQEDPISIGICTSGNSPLVSKALKEKIRESLPKHMAEVAKFMGEIREEIKEIPLEGEKRKALFSAIYQKAEQKQRALTKKEVASVLKTMFGDQYDNISKK